MGKHDLPDKWVKLFQATSVGRFWTMPSDPKAGHTETKRATRKRKRRRRELRKARRANR